MSLEKVITEDKVEIVGVFCAVQIRTATNIVEDGAVLSSSYHRHAIMAGQDYSKESAKVQAICASVHTPELIEAYEEYLASQNPPIAE